METQYVAKRAYGVRVPTGFFIFHGHDPKIDYNCGNNSFIIPKHEGHEKQLEKFMANQSADFRVETTKVIVRETTPDGVKHLGWVRPVVPVTGDEAMRDADDAAGAASAEEMTAEAEATAPPPEPETTKPKGKKAKGKKGGK